MSQLILAAIVTLWTTAISSVELCPNEAVAGSDIADNPAVMMLVLWVVFVHLTSFDFWVLGTLDWDSPISFCAVVEFGNKRQHELSPPFVCFILSAYIFSIIAARRHSWRSRCMYNQFDNNCTSMQDFSLWLSNLPNIPGIEKPEEDESH